MQYRKLGSTGVSVSALGFGCMRFPTETRGNEAIICEDEAIAMLRESIDQGLNYVDTAYPYHQQQSESLVGKALKDGYRDKVCLATKSPMWLIKQEGDFEHYLDIQLSRLQVEHIDFYLLHALNQQRWDNVVQPLSILDRLEQAKRQGKIGHIGFSFHDRLPAFKKIVDGYDWEFCQIQHNYIDIEDQAGTAGLRYAAAKGLGVIIMEPLLGGKLAVPPASVSQALGPKKTPAEWGLDFLWNQPEVSVVLSGMGSMQQVRDNLKYADRSYVHMLSEQQLERLTSARTAYQALAKVPCTNCGYCMPCPVGLDIPALYKAYNLTAYDTVENAKKAYAEQTVKADACQSCMKCNLVCPQGIDPRIFMKEAAIFFKDQNN